MTVSLDLFFSLTRYRGISVSTYQNIIMSEIMSFFSATTTCYDSRLLSVTKKEKVKQRPLALNTVEMLRMASSKLGMGPQYTMQVAERLYTQGYISYPRTETTSYPENADLRYLLLKLK